MKYWYIFPIVALVSLALTALLRQYALRRSIIDIPNARSSHTVPTPRGGGVAIVLTFAFALVWLAGAQLITVAESAALLGAGLLIAIIGFMDDHGHIAARWRLLGHFAAAIWMLSWMQGLPAISAFGVTFDLGWVGHVLAVFYLVWMLNLYNFMDGIDGLASLQAICACLALTLIYFLSGQPSMMWAPLLLSASVAGFLYWNFPPARIFMGDAGSGFLGIILGGLSVQAAWAGSEFFFAWLIMLGVFIVDATFTLIRRLARGDKVYEAHRSHAYQFASRQYGRHLPVTLAVAVINVVWLLPLALAVALFGLDAGVGTVIAYLPLVFLAVKYSAGQRE
ncbi:MAG: glycosyltransferase family 4 protein [Pseudomonas sp.]|uniref:MraY family glycosyltransferase n=1 Tax=Pseudomonas TaxID=286 RepID=UPI0014742884|nr:MULTISPECIES: glycosyltransferase family 4 protein [Pseudomonas]MBL7227188.1 glycosyltransferase family 4 protein [Pseudomonas sp.]NMX31057.1 glycosyltransferase family 4 protein [Pseudomonas sp. WS 5413]NMY21910.1 glycosyltransferase family 4 protein [Pseudomonas sp. WS 5410]QXH91177.1 glycosyltransferase family 4 protein [Pseudomonas shahriarae]QYM70715.1 glycosyltransferase family 4 protein [Pseudomonas sp. So3.2b]